MDKKIPENPQKFKVWTPWKLAPIQYIIYEHTCIDGYLNAPYKDWLWVVINNCYYLVTFIVKGFSLWLQVLVLILLVQI